MKQVKTIVMLLLIILAVTAAYQNISPIKGKTITLGLDLYVASWQTQPIPLGFVVVLCFVAGAFIMGLVDFPAMLRLRKRVKTLEKDLSLYHPAGAVALSDSSDDGPEDPTEDKENG